jgi:hypothetical protein
LARSRHRERETPNPPNGIIERDANGAASGGVARSPAPGTSCGSIIPPRCSAGRARRRPCDAGLVLANHVWKQLARRRRRAKKEDLERLFAPVEAKGQLTANTVWSRPFESSATEAFNS